MSHRFTRRSTLTSLGAATLFGLMSPAETAAAPDNGDPTSSPDVANVQFYDVDTCGLRLGDISIRGGKTLQPVIAIGSGAFAVAGTNPPEFLAVADSGPAIDCENAAALTGRSPTYFCGDTRPGEIRPAPGYSPTIYRVALEGGRTARVTGRTALADTSGSDITTLTNPLSNGTTPTFSIHGNRIPFDPNGLDLEGVVQLSDGRMWVSEEYAPSIVEVASDGEVLTRHVPATIDTDLAAATYPVAGSLPEVFKRRDRGLESLGVAPDESLLYFAFQSPLANPDVAAFEASRNVRVGTFDPSEEAVTAQYLYRLDRPETFTKDAAAGAVTQSDVKVSELTVVGPERLLVLERISQTTKFYLVDLSGVDPIPERFNALDQRPTLAQLDPATVSDVEPAPKELVFSTDEFEGFPAKLEAIAQPTPQELLILNDSDFQLTGDETSIARVRLTGPLGGPPGR